MKKNVTAKTYPMKSYKVHAMPVSALPFFILCYILPFSASPRTYSTKLTKIEKKSKPPKLRAWGLNKGHQDIYSTKLTEIEKKAYTPFFSVHPFHRLYPSRPLHPAHEFFHSGRPTLQNGHTQKSVWAGWQRKRGPFRKLFGPDCKPQDLRI